MGAAGSISTTTGPRETLEWSSSGARVELEWSSSGDRVELEWSSTTWATRSTCSSFGCSQIWEVPHPHT
jgi:hypothetical protein